MKRTGFFLFFAATAGLIALRAADNKDIYTQKDEKDVRQIEAQWAAAIQNGDTATLEQLLAADYTFVDASGKTLNKSQEIARYKSGELKFDSFATTDKKVIIYIGGAIVTGKASVKGKDKSEDVSGDYRFVDIIERRKGTWQPVYSQITKIETEKDKKKKNTK